MGKTDRGILMKGINGDIKSNGIFCIKVVCRSPVGICLFNRGERQVVGGGGSCRLVGRGGCCAWVCNCFRLGGVLSLEPARL